MNSAVTVTRMRSISILANQFNKPTANILNEQFSKPYRSTISFVPEPIEPGAMRSRALRKAGPCFCAISSGLVHEEVSVATEQTISLPFLMMLPTRTFVLIKLAGVITPTRAEVV